MSISSEVASHLVLSAGRKPGVARELARQILQQVEHGALSRYLLATDPELALEQLSRRIQARPEQTLAELERLMDPPAPAAAACPPRPGRRPLSFVKWAGSKASVMKEILTRMPPRFCTYFEPMVGSGTVFFSLEPQRAVLSDLNAELMGCYQVIRDRLEPLLAALARHRNTRAHYLRVRAQVPDRLSAVERAARTIFLNKTCYNGLYRVNSRGLFNVPYGGFKWANICDEPTLRRVSRLLHGITLRTGCYRDCLQDARAGDLVYFDPPYLSPGTRPTIFFSYQPQAFGLAEHEELARTFRALDQKGCRVLLSNSNVEQVHELYAGYTIDVIRTQRKVNCIASAREGWEEVIVSNARQRSGSCPIDRGS